MDYAHALLWSQNYLLTPVTCVVLLCSVATERYGLLMRILSHPALQALAPSAMAVYTLHLCARHRGP